MALKGGPGVFTIELRLVGEDTGACLSGGRGRGRMVEVVGRVGQRQDRDSVT